MRKMRIVTVEFRRLVSHGEYSNTTIGAVAEVNADPVVVLAELHDWVNEQVRQVIGDHGAVRTAQEELWDVQAKVRKEVQRLQHLAEQIEVLHRVLAKHGIVPDADDQHAAALAEDAAGIPF